MAATNGIATRDRVAPPAALTVFGRVLDYNTRQKLEFVNLTEPVEQMVRESSIRDGMVLVQSLHTTAAIFANEWQDALLDDFRALLEQAVGDDAPWRHNDPRFSDCDRSNAASHLRAFLLGPSVMLAVRGGQLVRGVWQSIILAELDGPRTRSVSVQVFGSGTP
ncbi:MAG: secondary thiamine-phosphate synthase enzyme YjbQ [Bryobacteraceae bacterium]